MSAENPAEAERILKWLWKWWLKEISWKYDGNIWNNLRHRQKNVQLKGIYFNIVELG